MKDYPVRMTLGQVIFVTLCLCVCGFLTFYLGARFGPEVFWNIKLDRLTQESLLPNEISEKELALLLEEEDLPVVTFHEELQKKEATIGILKDNRNKNELVVSPPKGASESVSIQQAITDDNLNDGPKSDKMEGPVKKALVKNEVKQELAKPMVKQNGKQESKVTTSDKINSPAVAKKTIEKAAEFKKAATTDEAMPQSKSQVTQAVSPALNKPIAPSESSTSQGQSDMW